LSERNSWDSGEFRLQSIQARSLAIVQSRQANTADIQTE
jgi:hypothetical protein